MKKLACTLLVGLMMCQGASFASPDSKMESESNNTFATADKLYAIDETKRIYGTVNSFDQIDCYALKSLSDARVTVKFKFDRRNSSDDVGIDFYIYRGGTGSSDRVLYAPHSDGYERFSVDLKADEYLYLKVDRDTGFLGEPYYIEYSRSK